MTTNAIINYSYSPFILDRTKQITGIKKRSVVVNKHKLYCPTKRVSNIMHNNGRVYITTYKSDTARKKYENFVHEKYQQAYQANLKNYLPYLVAVKQPEETLDMVFGYSDSSADKFFLESYLDGAIENKLSKVFNTTIKRSEIIEIGNLAIGKSTDNGRDIYDIACFAYANGYRWIACTATRMLRLAFIHAGTRLSFIANADIDKINASEDDWGSYYNYVPQISAGNLADCIEQMEVKLGIKKNII